MTDAELIARLRGDHPDYLTTAAADRIEALIAERDQWIAHAKNAIWADSEELQAAEAKLAENEVRLLKAVEALDKMNVGEGWAAQIARATLARVKGESK